ncbi:MAG: hypothetical protein QNJ27_01075 [Simkaniaceae bacterium]|nr:hypothetical protein [Simkaniaceae bacterium]
MKTNLEGEKSEGVIVDATIIETQDGHIGSVGHSLQRSSQIVCLAYLLNTHIYVQQDSMTPWSF